MNVNRNELLGKLDVVRPGLSKKEIVEQMGHFIFTGADCATFNDRICIQHECEMPGKFSVDADVFYRALTKIGGKEVNLTLNDKAIVIKNKNSEVSIAIELENELAEVINDINKEVNEKEDDWKELPADFIRAINFVKFSASADESEVLSCIRVKGNEVASADGSRGTVYRMEGEVKGEFLIRASIAKELKGKFVEYLVTEGWLHFSDDEENLFSVRRIMGDYPDLEPVFDAGGEMVKFEFGEDILEHIDFVDTMTDKEVGMKSVEMVLGESSLEMSAMREIGFAKRKVGVEDGPKPPVEFFINPALFVEILGQTKEVIICKDTFRLLFKTDKFSHILMMRAASTDTAHSEEDGDSEETPF